VTKRIIAASAVLALVSCAGSVAFAMEEQSVAVPPTAVAPAAGSAVPQVGVQEAAPVAKSEKGTEIRIPGLGKLGTLPKMDFGLELLYGAADGKAPQDPAVDDNQDLMIRGSVKHKF
jgi:hypothetical protein